MDGGEPGDIDVGVALRRRQRGVAEQLLDGPEIAAAGKQVGGEAVTQRVRRRRLRQAQERPQPAHLPLHHAGIEGTAADADEQRGVGCDRMRAYRQIGAEGLADDGEHRHQPLLAALAGDHHGVARRHVLASQAQRLADPEAAAVEKREQGDVAERHPGGIAEIGGGLDDAAGVGDGERLRHRHRHPRRAQRAHGGVVDEPPSVEKAEETAHGGERPGDRGPGQAAGGAVGEVGAEVRGRQRPQLGEPGRAAEMSAQEAEKRLEIAAVGVPGVACGPPLVGEPREPGGGGGGDIRRRRSVRLQAPAASRRSRHRSTTRARKRRSSVPCPGWNIP